MQLSAFFIDAQQQTTNNTGSAQNALNNQFCRWKTSKEI